jgi:hypothetical protein
VLRITRFESTTGDCAGGGVAVPAKAITDRGSASEACKERPRNVLGSAGAYRSAV